MASPRPTRAQEVDEIGGLTGSVDDLPRADRLLFEERDHPVHHPRVDVLDRQTERGHEQLAAEPHEAGVIHGRASQRGNGSRAAPVAARLGGD
jgi:hypothetical protein